MTTFQRIIKYCAMAFAAFLSISIIGGICSAIGMVYVFFSGEAAGEMRTYEVGQEIESLDLDISAAGLKIVEGECFSVKSNHKYLSVKEKKGRLHISESKSFFGISSKNVSVELTVPKNYDFDNVNISAGAGKVDIERLSADKLDMEFGAGAAKIEFLEVHSKADVETGTGKLTIKDGDMKDTSLDLGVGELVLTGKLTGDCDVDYGIGNTELNIKGAKEDYRIKINKGIGEAKLDGEEMSDGSTYGNGENHIDIDGGIGTLKINFEKE